jgi:hypothetical protein
LGGTLITADANEFNYLDITTLGTVQASKAVTADSGGDVFFPAGSVLTVGSDGSNPSMVIRGSGPNEVMFAGDSTGTDTDGVSLLYRTNPNDLEIVRASGQGVIAKFNGNTGVAELWHANQGPKLATTSTGVTVGGTLVTDGVTLGDSELITLGTDSDATITHTGSNLEIDNNTGITKFFTGQLYIQGQFGSSDETMAQFSKNGAVQLYYDNELRFRTTSTGIDILGEDDDSSSDNTANIRIIAEGSNEIVTLRSHNGNAQYISRNGTNYGAHLFQGFGTVTPNTINMLQLTSTGHTSYQDLDVQGTLTADDITLHTGSSSLLKFQSPDGSHGYTLRANVNDSVDYGFYLEDIDGTDVLEIRGSAADVNANIATFHRGIVEIKNAGTQSELRLYCESNNAHYLALKAPPHSAFSGNQTITLPAGGTLLTDSSSIADLSNVNITGITDGQVLQWNNSAGRFDPATVSSGSSGVTVQDEGSALSTTGTTLNFVGAGVTASGTGSTKTITISGGSGSSGGTTSQTWGASLNGKLNIWNSSRNTIISSQNLSNPEEPSDNMTGAYNTTLGYKAGDSITSANNNVYIGNEAAQNVTGHSNVAVGSQCIGNDTTSNYGTYVGFEAGENQTIGTSNTMIGRRAGRTSLSPSTTGNSNTYIGTSAAGGYYTQTAMTSNTCVGVSAGNGLRTGSYNTHVGTTATTYYNNSSYGVAIGYQTKHNHNQCTAVGARAGYAQSSQSDYHTLVGYGAGYDLNGADYCTYIGVYAGRTVNGTGSFNTAIGHHSMYNATSALRNAGLGYAVFNRLTSGEDNTALGANAGYEITTGSGNTAIGFNALNPSGTYNFTGSNCTVIGRDSLPSSQTVSNEITLGNSSITSLRCQVQTISSLSDQRDKTAIEDLDLGLDFIKAMRPVKFAWNRRDGKWHGRKEVGFIAQELHEVEMDFNSTDRTRLVSHEDPSKLEARPMNTYPILVKAIQELSAKVDSLQARITELEGE